MAGYVKPTLSAWEVLVTGSGKALEKLAQKEEPIKWELLDLYSLPVCRRHIILSCHIKDFLVPPLHN